MALGISLQPTEAMAGSPDSGSAGGKLAAAEPEAEEQGHSKRSKPKVSRKERIQRKRDQRRAERQAGSDDEDLGQGELHAPLLSLWRPCCHTCQPVGH